MKHRVLVCISMMMVSLSAALFAATPTPGAKMTSGTSFIGVNKAIAAHLTHYMDYKVLGVCVFLEDHVPVTVPELSEYEPDMVVTVYPHQHHDPLFLINTIYDSLGFGIGNSIINSLFGIGMANTSIPGDNSGNKANQIHDFYVDVIGDLDFVPFLPFPQLPVQTTPLYPYYFSYDDFLNRLGISEAVLLASWNPFDHYVGSSYFHKWGYEFPRDFALNTYNKFEGSVIAAMHGADLVTNKHFLHDYIKGVSDSCGKDCDAYNVIAKNGNTHEKWQEVYPEDVQIKPGIKTFLHQSSLHYYGYSDEQKGHGEYVFVLWRHYEGCLDGSGQLISMSVPVTPVKKRD